MSAAGRAGLTLDTETSRGLASLAQRCKSINIPGASNPYAAREAAIEKGKEKEPNLPSFCADTALLKVLLAMACAPHFVVGVPRQGHKVSTIYAFECDTVLY